MPRRSVHNAPFISFEGGEGAGKTTQVELLRQRLESLNLPVLVVREPGTTRLGEQVRDIIKSQSNNVPAADALLFMAARAQLMADIIVPELKKGTTVIGDRFSDSTIAYQGYGGRLNLDRLRHANELATDGVAPDLTILLDVPPETGLSRRDAEDDSTPANPNAASRNSLSVSTAASVAAIANSPATNQTDGSRSKPPETPTRSPKTSGDTFPNSSN